MKKQRAVFAKVGILAHLALAALLAGGAVQPTAQASEPRMGAHLIGAIEGPAVVTDPARTPAQFREAPALSALVRQRELPPAGERRRPVHG